MFLLYHEYLRVQLLGNKYPKSYLEMEQQLAYHLLLIRYYERKASMYELRIEPLRIMVSDKPFGHRQSRH